MKPRGRVVRALAPLTLLVALLAPAACGSPASATPVTVLGPWTGQEQQTFKQVLAAFTLATGIPTVYQGTRALDEVIQADIARRTPPDVVVLPNPGALRSYVFDYGNAGLRPLHVAPGRYAPLWQKLTTFNRHRYAVVVTAALKSIIWYVPQAIRQFEPPGWNGLMPRDWKHLMTLTNAITAHGRAPWCIGVGSTSASGWPGTDWIGDIVLHRFGIDVYQAWANGTLLWTNPKIRRAWQQWAALLNGVNGGPTTALFTDFGDAGAQMYHSPPGCYLYHAAFSGFPGPHPKPGKDFNYFPFPAMSAHRPAASMVSADLAGTFRDTPGSRKLITFLASDQGQALWLSLPQSDQYSADENLMQARYRKLYTDPVRRAIEQTLTGTGTLCFGASDLMPPELSRAFNQAVVMALGDTRHYLPRPSGLHLPRPSGLQQLLNGLDQVRKQAYGNTHPMSPCA
jgi:alpha-glucoside transport system substrate-binding protein